MFEKIYIHIGLPKTGSTAVQNCMEALSRAGELSVVSYPTFGAERGEQSIQSGNGAAIAELLAPDITPVFCVVRLQEIFCELIAACEPSKDIVLISSEVFFSASAERFLQFKELLLKSAKDIELIMCARSLNEICYSSYHQVVKRHGYALGYSSDWFSQFVDDLLCSRLQSVEQWDIVGKVLEYRKDQLLYDFLGLIGEDVALAKRFDARRVNRSLTKEELELLLKINAVFGSESLSMRISDSWLRARPEVLSVESLHDTAALYELFDQKYSSFKSSFSNEAVKKVIEIIGFNDGDESPLNVAARLTSNSSDNGISQGNYLLSLALSEIKRFLGLDAALGAYIGQFNATQEAFDPIHYLLLNRDVLAEGVDPVLHYKEFGKAEGRSSAFNLTGIFTSNV